MAKLIICKGLPGSGKSTWARDTVSVDDTTVRVNRDDLRKLMFNGAWTQRKEKLIINAEKNIARNALSEGYNVIVDDTNLRHPERGPWTHFDAINLDAIEVKDFTTVPWTLCLQRDATRKYSANGRVGRAIITKMALENGLVDWNNIYDDEEPSDKQGIVIVDIDGTVANLDHRLHLIDAAEKKKDYREFHKQVDKDEPIRTVIEWVQALYQEYIIVFVSGRSDECAIATEEWLNRHVQTYDLLLMRRGGDYRADYIIKKELLDLLPRDRIEWAIDDRPQVIEKCWKANDIKVYPVNQDRWEGKE